MTFPTANPSFLPTPTEALRQTSYRERISKYLRDFFGKLFAEFTGIHFHVAWTPLLPRHWDARSLPTGCSARCRLAGISIRAGCACRRCGPKHLALALQSGTGHRFTCHFGIRNYWLPLRVRGVMVGIAYLRAFNNHGDRRPVRKPTDHAPGAFLPGTAPAPERGNGEVAKVLNRSEFARATKFLRLIVQHAQTSVLVELNDTDLTRARNATYTLEREQSRLRKEINHLFPAVQPTPPVPTSRHHTEQILHAVLERLYQDYAQPITLQQCADQLHLSPAYLSDLFSRGIGLPFKRYLTEMRLERAKALLGLPQFNLADVARAVGYASENRFRIAFRKSTGLSPRTWRETMRMSPLQPARPTS